MNRLFTLISLLFSFGLALAQEKKDMPNLDEFYPDIDTVVNESNYLLKVNIDTLYIINKQALVDYKTCRDSYTTLREEAEQIIQLKSVIENVDKDFDVLNTNLKALEKKYEASLNQNIETNTYLKEKNQLAEKELNVAKDNLKKAEQKIKAEKWNSKASKLIWGVGGALVGGALIAISK